MKSCIDTLFQFVAAVAICLWLCFGDSENTEPATDPNNTEPPTAQRPNARPATLIVPIDADKLRAACDHLPLRPCVLPVIQPESAGPFGIAQTCDVFDFLKSRWVYIQDPADEEFFAPAIDSWHQPSGDCDDQAICAATALRAIGGRSIITFSSRKKDRAAHAWAEICLGKVPIEVVAQYLSGRYGLAPSRFHYRVDGSKNLILPLDLSADWPGGVRFRGDDEWRFDLVSNRWEHFKWD